MYRFETSVLGLDSDKSSFFYKPAEWLKEFKDISAMTACCDQGDKEDKHLHFLLSIFNFSIGIQLIFSPPKFQTESF